MQRIRNEKNLVTARNWEKCWQRDRVASQIIDVVVILSRGGNSRRRRLMAHHTEIEKYNV
jgi:hypothetical protein